ncbi:MAG: autotransporter-associated beta strand repeat-containing protein, partial [Thermoguttaceae bacterium]|nr:autotransporter-associated beta strand repeat-containing protein [Thermoguttaceae bacterium]
MYYPNDWSTAGEWSGGIAPDSTNGAYFAVGDGNTLRVPCIYTYAPNDTEHLNPIYEPKTFPFLDGGTINSLYLGYSLQNGQLVPDTGYLTIKIPETTIDDLVIGNGTVYQGNNITQKINNETVNVPETLHGNITVKGNATFNIKNGDSSDNRTMTIESSIGGDGTLNFTTGKKTSGAGFTIASSLNSFSGPVTIDNKTRVTFTGVDAFKNASSITSEGYLTINANQTFNGPLNCTKGEFNFKVTVVQEDGNYVMKSGNVVLESGGTVSNLSYRVTSSMYTDPPYNIPSATVSQFTATHGNITNNSSEDLILNNTTYSAYMGTIDSTGTLMKTGSGTLTLTSSENQSIKHGIVINEGIVLLDNKIDGKDRFGGDVTINAGGTLACKAQDSFGNGSAAITININGGTLQLNSKNNQTFMNKTVELTGGEIKSLVSDCKGIEMKTGTSITAHTSPTTSTISVPIKVRTGVQLKIKVDANARLEFTSAIYKQDNNTIGIKKEGPGVLVFAGTFWDPDTEANRYTSDITVSQGVLQLTDEALQTYGPVYVNNGAQLDLYVAAGETKTTTIKERRIYSKDVINSIFSTGEVKKTGNGTLKILSESQGMISAESMVVSSGRLDMQGYFSGQLSVAANATFSPGNSPGSLTIEQYVATETDENDVTTIVSTTPAEFVLQSETSKLLMEIGGTSISMNDSLIVEGPLTLNDGIVYLVLADDSELEPGDDFTAVLSGSNSVDIASNFISKYVRTNDFTDLIYEPLEEGSGTYVIRGRVRLH